MSNQQPLSITTTARYHGPLRAETQRLLHRMLSPMTGLDTQIGFTLRSRDAARIIMAGAEMTGIHVLRGEARPPRGFYHIGGAGLFKDEAIIRSLGETVERYTQFASEIKYRGVLVRETHAGMVARGEPVLDPSILEVYSDRQYEVTGFPYRRYNPDDRLNWVRTTSLKDGSSFWAPAQCILVGYRVREDDGEPRLGLAVTTGGAAHVSGGQALRNCLLELFQIDAAMGHWYGKGKALRIIGGKRTEAVDRIVWKRYGRTRINVQFYWIQSADLPGFCIACVLSQPGDAIPALAIGLGADLGLQEAMYKALLEAAGVAQLAKVTLMDMSIGESNLTPRTINPDGIMDLDSNVAYYALPGNGEVVTRKFDERETIDATDLPADGPAAPDAAAAFLVDGFTQAGHNLVGLDLTTRDAHTLGFVAARVWAPDVITLCMPSAPPAEHPRFSVYGGFSYVGPHPYP